MSIILTQVEIETNAGGTGVGVVSGLPAALLHQIRYVIDGSDPYAAGATLAITEDVTGYNLLTIPDFTTVATSLDLCPRQPRTDSTDGSGGAVLDTIAVVNNVTVTVTDGGNTKKGNFFLYFREV